VRALILKSNTACIENINPRSPASSGRFDVILDFVLECLYGDKSVRKDVTIYAVLSGCGRTRTIVFRGEELPYIETEDDLLRLVLSGDVQILDMGFEELLEDLSRRGFRLFCLIEDGKDVDKVELPCSNVGFIIGDQDGFTPDDVIIMRRRNIEFISIGPLPYLSWFCCVFINYVLDRRCRDS